MGTGKAVRASEESLESLRIMGQTFPEAMVLVDCSGRIVFWNPMAERMFGFKAEEILGKTPDLISPGQSPENYRDILKGSQTFVPGTHATDCVRKDGTVFPTEVSFSRLSAAGEVFYCAIVRDITERKRFEVSLLETKEFLDNVIESSLDSIVITDNKGCIGSANRAFQELLGLAPDDYLGKSIFAMAPESEGVYECTTGSRVKIGRDYFNDLERHAAVLVENKKVSNWVTYYRRNDMKLVPVEQNIASLFNREGKPIGALGVVRDITERKRSEEALQVTQFAVDTAGEAIIWVGSDARIRYANQMAGRLFGCSREELLRLSVKDISPDYSPERWRTGWEMIERRGSVTHETRQMDRAGRVFPAETTVNYFTYGEGVYGCVFIRDITQRKLAEAALHEGKERFRSVVEAAHDAIIIVDEDRLVSFWNRSAEKMFGYAAEEILGRHVNRILPDRCRTVDFSTFENIRLENPGAVLPRIAERCGLKKGGDEFPVEVSYSSWSAHQGVFYVAIIRDITERKRVVNELEQNQKKLRASQQNIKRFSGKMITIREEEKKLLSLNLHDELGSLAVSVGTRLSIAEDEIRSGHTAKVIEALSQVKGLLKSSVGRMRKMAADLRPPELDIVGLPSALREYCENAVRQTGIELSLSIGLDRKRIREEAAIALYRVTQEAFNNILKHAAASRVTVTLAEESGRLRLSVKDDGRGYDLKSKSGQGGTGMGVQGMKERIESLGGGFLIRSSARKGSEVVATLPL